MLTIIAQGLLFGFMVFLPFLFLGLLCIVVGRWMIAVDRRSTPTTVEDRETR